MIGVEFEKIVQDKFSFLITQFDFHCVVTTNYKVCFETKKVFVTIFYDARKSYELDVEIGQLDNKFNGHEIPFNLGEILRLKGVSVKEKYTYYQANDISSLSSCITHLALLVSTYAVDFLLNKELSFKCISNLREQECNQYEIKTKLANIRVEVQIAWKNKEYVKVEKLYRPVEKFLSGVEKKKLAFAHKQINRQGQ